MTILSAQSIMMRHLLHPMHPRTECAGLTYGLGPAGYDVRLDGFIHLPAGGFSLASTMEEFFMPYDVLGVVHDKSTWARRGVTVQNTVIEPGWHGFLTLELVNHSAAYLNLHAGTPIAQVVFHLLDEPTNSPYPGDGKYQNQERGPQVAR